MRIVHLSDIHLSKDNFPEFENNYRRALINTLKEEHEIKKIDVIAITGDLVDKGGHSLLEYAKFTGCSDPYEIFEQEFINPIKSALNFQNKHFLFIPGNHDISENEILWIDEKKLQDEEVAGKINDLLQENRAVFNKTNKRIELFKKFEYRFHNSITDNYQCSNNESTFILKYSEEINVGFALINDSWRCSTCHLHKYKDKKLYFGEQQLYDALNVLEASNTTCNIILTHHPLSTYAEESLVKRALVNKSYHLHLFGDQHKQEYTSYLTPDGNCFGIMARVALNRPDEPESKWQPGFHIIDIDFYNANIELITFYKYIHDRCRFAKDTDTADDGCDRQKHKLSFNPVLKPAKLRKENFNKNDFIKS